MTSFDNSDDVIDSRDVIARLEELREQHEAHESDGTVMDESDRAEFEALTKLASEAENYGDWMHGATLIRESYFVDHIRELIADCYPMPKEIGSGEWPWRHVTIDYEAAAEEAKVDYAEVDYDGETYLILA